MECAGLLLPETELRSGRRILGQTMAPGDPGSASPIVIVSQPRDPGFFYGTDDEDVEDWLKMYERVSAYNRWDPTIMLANVEYHLKGTAKTWYETEEAKVTSWEYCKQRLRELFGNPVGRQLAAKKELATRAQTPTESYVSYIHDVLSLCMKADAQMTESDKVGHVLKGIADDAFNLLMCKDCTTVDAIIKECRKFEQAKGRRVVSSFTRLPNTAPTSSCEDPVLRHRLPSADGSGDAPGNLTRAIRRELEAMAPAAPFQSAPQHNQPSVSLIQAVVRQEIENLGLHSVCAVNRPIYYEAAPAMPRRTAYQSSTYRNPADWRTPDDRPICFSCRRVGHVARYCQTRWFRPARRNFPDFQNANVGDRPFPTRNQQQDPNTGFSTSRFNRSPSPQRRQSRSPPSRRSTSPTNYASSSPEN